MNFFPQGTLVSGGDFDFSDTRTQNGAGPYTLRLQGVINTAGAASGTLTKTHPAADGCTDTGSFTLLPLSPVVLDVQ
jgi:hypothetical protein